MMMIEAAGRPAAAAGAAPGTLVEAGSVGREIPVAAARRVSIAREVSVSATLTYDVDHYAEVTLPHGARIVRLAAHLGDEVARDAVVAVLDGGRVLRAPIAGTVVRVAAADHAADAEVCAIADLDWLSAYAFVDAATAARLRTGIRAALHGADGGAPAVTGRLSRIERWTADGDRAFRLRIEVANVRRALRPGISLRGTLVDDDAPSVYAIVVPRAAVLADGDARVVFVREEGGRFHRRAVHVGTSGGDWIEITDGVADGETVATGGFAVLKTRLITSNDQGGSP